MRDGDMEGGGGGGGGGGTVLKLTSDGSDYEAENVREVPASGGGSSSGSGSLKPGTYSNASDDKPRFLDHMAQSLGDYGVTRVHLAYISIGILVVVDALVSVVVLCHHPREARSRQEGGPMASARPARALLFTVIFSAFMFVAEALQGALHHLLASTGGPSGLPLTWSGESEGPDGQVVFWGLVCLVRFLCVPAAGCLGPRPGRLLVAAVFFEVAGGAFLVVGAPGRSDFAWSGVVFLAVGVAPVLPTSLLWMAQHMRVTHRLCALMVVVASFGNTLTHSLLAEAAAHPPTYAYLVLGLALTSAFLLGVSACAVHAGHHADNMAPVGYQLASQHEEDNLELTPSASVVFTPADAGSHEGGEAGQALLID